MVAAILALIAGSALADDNPSPATTSAAVTEPVVTTTGPANDPAQAIVTLPAEQTPQTAPASAPVPGLQVQTMLLEQVRSQIVLYRSQTWRLQSLLSLRRSPGGNIWGLGTPQAGKTKLLKWQNRAKQLRQAAIKQITQDRRELEYMYQVMGKRPVMRTLSTSGGFISHLQRIKQLKYQTARLFRNPPYESQFLCIHSGEGSWTDSGAPYWGGLQMNLGFMSTYGGFLLRTKGTANHWTPLEQIWTAAKAVASRGFNPWPSTARTCGLT